MKGRVAWVFLLAVALLLSGAVVSPLCSACKGPVVLKASANPDAHHVEPLIQALHPKAPEHTVAAAEGASGQEERLALPQSPLRYRKKPPREST